MSKTKKCPRCGSNVPASMRFCGNCGADLSNREDAFTDLPRPIRRPDEPRPVETVIRPEKRRGARRNVWQYILVLAIIAVVIAIAVILVIKMNEPAPVQQPSDSFETVHVINADGEEITATTAPEPSEAPAEPTEAPAEPTEAPAETARPEATEAPEAIEITETNDTVYVTGSGVNLRSGPGTSYDIVAVVSSGTALTRAGTTDSSWSRVQYNGRDCYISNALISTSAPASTSTPAPSAVTDADDTVVVTESANLRKGPGTEYDVITVVSANTELKRTGVSGSWSRVIYNGSEAYIASSLIRAQGSNELEEKTGKLTVTEEANLREGPGTNYSILGIAKAGAELDMTGVTDNWYRIEYEGKTAYVNGNLVKEN